MALKPQPILMETQLCDSSSQDYWEFITKMLCDSSYINFIPIQKLLLICYCCKLRREWQEQMNKSPFSVIDFRILITTYNVQDFMYLLYFSDQESITNWKSNS